MTWFYYFIVLFIISTSALAEYRVFELKIYKETVATPDPPSSEETTEEAKIVISNLDPEQYKGYYPLAAGEKVQYIATWMCRGRTNGKDYCPNPRLKAEDSLNEK